MSYVLIGVGVMSIVVALCAVLRAQLKSKHVHQLLAGFTRHTFAHAAGPGHSANMVSRPESVGEGWALIERALRARSSVRFDVR